MLSRKETAEQLDCNRCEMLNKRRKRRTFEESADLKLGCNSVHNTCFRRMIVEGALVHEFVIKVSKARTQVH